MDLNDREAALVAFGFWVLVVIAVLVIAHWLTGGWI
jgi:hypothetical protein